MKTMNNIKRIITGMTLSLALIGVSASAMAQDDAPEGAECQHKQRGRHKNMTDEQRLEHMSARLDERIAELTKALSLDKSQQTKLRQAFESEHTERMDIMHRHKGDRQAAHKEMAALRVKTQATVKATLTPAQQKTWQAQKDAKQAEHLNKRLDHMEQALSLDKAQRAKIEVILKDSHAKAQALRQSGADKHEALKQLKAQTHTKINAELKPEQQEKFKNFKGKGKGFGHGKRHGKGRHGEGHHGPRHDMDSLEDA